MSDSFLKKESSTKIRKLILGSDVKNQGISISICILDILPEEILNLILVDDMGLYSLYLEFSLTCKKAYTLLPTKRDFEGKILAKALERLLNRFENYPNGMGNILIDLIKQENALFAGGYVLQCITNDHWNTDIDVFIGTNDVKFANNHEQNAFEVNALEMLDARLGISCSESPFYNAIIDSDVKYGHLQQVIKIYALKIGNVEIQFIYVALNVNQTLEEYIKSKFDISLCKCWFDGKKIHSAHILDQIKREGILNDIEVQKKISESIMIYNVNQVEYFRDVIRNRMKKYEDRDFKIKMKEDTSSMINMDIEELYQSLNLNQ